MTCEIERLYQWAQLYGTDRLLATQAQGYVTVTGNIGATVLADSLMRAQTGFDYSVLSAVTLTATTALVQIRSEEAGKETNLQSGQVLTLVDPLLGIDNSVTVTVSGITGGADDEDVDSWRLRVAEEWRTMVIYGGRAGKIRDYKAWAKAAHPSVSGALVIPHQQGIGTVVVRPICNDLTNRLPTNGVINAIVSFLPDVVPATADVYVVAPLLKSITVELALEPDFDTAINRQAITDAVIALVASKVDELAVIELAELDAVIMSITSQYTRIQPTLRQVTAENEIFNLTAVVFS
jgi:uncharacterized phage protein gp47/JayE